MIIKHPAYCVSYNRRIYCWFSDVSLDLNGNTRRLPAHSPYLLLMTSVYLLLFIPFWKLLILSKLFYTNSISLYNTSSHSSSKPRTLFRSGIPTCILICREIFINSSVLWSCYIIFYVLFLHLCVVIYHSRIFLAATVSHYSSAIYVLHSLLHYIGAFFLIRLSLHILISEFLIETMLTKLSCSHFSGLNTVLPHFASYQVIRLDISIQSFFFVWLFLNIVALGFYYLTHTFSVELNVS
jgi:hypothetical protein